MSDLLKYKDYEGTIEYSNEDHRLFGKVLHIDSLVMYDGESVAEIEEAFHSAVDGYLEFCSQTGRQPNKPYSGSFNVRIGTDLHRSAAMAATRSGMKLNEFVRRAVQEKIDGIENHVVTHNTYNVYVNQSEKHVVDTTSRPGVPVWGTGHATTANAQPQRTH